MAKESDDIFFRLLPHTSDLAWAEDVAESLAPVLRRAKAEAWDEGWKAAQEIVELEGKKVWAHTVFPEGYEGNPYREA